MRLMRRTSSEPDLQTGHYTNVYEDEPLFAVSMPVENIIRQGVQRRPFEQGSYYDQQRRQFFIDLSLNSLTTTPKTREWIIEDSRRYEIESVENINKTVLRVVARQETEVEPTEHITEHIRSTMFLKDTTTPEVLTLLVLPDGQGLIVDDGDPGFTTFGFWFGPQFLGYGGSCTPSSGPFNPGGSARWTLPATPGVAYQVSVTWPQQDDWNPSSFEVPVAFSVYDDTTLVHSAEYSQGNKPVSFRADGVQWQILGELTPASSTIIVEIGPLPPSITLVRADAARLDEV